MSKIKKIQKAIEPVARQHNLKKVELFGSYARGNNTFRSDIDLLVDFDNPELTLFDVVRIKRDLEKSLRKKVDIIELGAEKNSFAIIDKVVPIYG